MKLLLVHNDYGKYSGEEAMVDKMAIMMTEAQWNVSQLRMSTAGMHDSLLGQVRGFISGIWCPSGIKDMRKALEREKPDVVNVHNLYPFISPAALRECKKKDIPVIMTIHNFRLICPTGLFMRNSEPCERCLEKGNEWGCIKYNCEQSIPKSIGYAARNAVARLKRHYLECVDYYACITDFQRRKLIQAGYPQEKIIVIPNSININEKYYNTTGNYVAYSGRISSEKGVDLILEVAKRHSEIPFKLAGYVRDAMIVKALPSNVELMGYLSGDQLEKFYSNAKFFVMASKCYEGFPMAILEAAQYHKPMVAPNHGGFTEIIGSGEQSIGRLFIPNDVNMMEQQIVELWNSPDITRDLGDLAFRKLREQYSTKVISQLWQQLFDYILTKATS